MSRIIICPCRLISSYRSLLKGKLFTSTAEFTCVNRNFIRLSSTTKIVQPLEKELTDILKLRTSNTSNWCVENKARALCCKYLEKPKNERHEFIKTLAFKQNTNQQKILTAAEDFLKASSNEKKMEYQQKLKKSLVPPYYWLFTIIGRLEHGVKFLVDLRTDVLEILGEPIDVDVSSIYQLNSVLQDLLLLWFSVGFLHLERVTWRSPCDLIEKVSKYEAIHPIRNWLDLKHRVGIYRRCYIFTHPAMPREPLIVLHTALCSKIPEKLQEIDEYTTSSDNMSQMSYSQEDGSKIKTAVFYSIGATQKGLAGIQLGYYLIKEVVQKVTTEFPSICEYSSLSPIPLFKEWFMQKLRKDVNLVFTKDERESLETALQTENIQTALSKLFLNTLWTTDEKICNILKTPLLRACANYLYTEKKRNYALDKVAHFHLSNGAVMWRINWMAHTSPRHVGSSFGIMVNYRYYLNDCELNSRNYIENYFINVGENVQRLIDTTDTKCH